jgi:hypothetical protein
MNLFLLPGNSKASNEPWIKEVAKTLATVGKQYLLVYDHWKTGDMLMDIENEVDRLGAAAHAMEDVAIFAKSAGCLVALRAINESRVQPRVCVFVGFPGHFAKDIGIDVKELLTSLKVPILFIQQQRDPAYSAGDLMILLKQVKATSCKVLRIEGNSHNYPDVGQLGRYTTAFLKTN